MQTEATTCSPKLAVFQMNGYDWVAAESLEQATAWYLRETGVGEDDLEDPRECTDDEMEGFKHLGEDGCRAKWPKERIPNFRQELNTAFAEGQAFPCLFASTEW